MIASFSAECVAPTMVSDGLLHYQKVDLPMGEFWLNSPTHDKPNDMLDAISGRISMLRILFRRKVSRKYAELGTNIQQC